MFIHDKPLITLTDNMLENSGGFQKTVDSDIELAQLRVIFLCADLRVKCGNVEQS